MDRSRRWTWISTRRSILKRSGGTYCSTASGVTADGQAGARRLTAEELPDAVQVGTVQDLRESGIAADRVGDVPAASASGRVANGLALTDSKGQRHDLSSAQNPRLEIVRPGPVTVGLRYTAAVPIEHVDTPCRSKS